MGRAGKSCRVAGPSRVHLPGIAFEDLPLHYRFHLLILAINSFKCILRPAMAAHLVKEGIIGPFMAGERWDVSR